MLMKAVIYESNTGFTKRYAEMLAEKFNLPVFSLKEAGKSLEKGAEVVFLGWVYANSVVGFKKAAKRFSVKAVCAVGAFPKNAAVLEIMKEKNKPECPLFYLRGGLDLGKLKGLKKKLLDVVRADLVAQNKPEDSEMIEILTSGGDFVSEENLTDIVAFMLTQM